MFGTNALGIMIVGQINRRLVGRISPRRLLTVGLSTMALVIAALSLSALVAGTMDGRGRAPHGY
jgi:DHA1 family bicyclomycin/chloramphenicol resistance-like MFS transporter